MSPVFGEQVHVEVEHRYSAPPERVWARYTDHAGWTDWAGAGTVTLFREGEPHRDGVGCIRRIAAPSARWASARLGVVVREVVIVFEPPRRMVYRVLDGGPIRDHEAEVELEALASGGTRLLWRCRFTPRIPLTGWLARRVVTLFFGRVLRRLERALAA
jgi:uncharacterized protein YndB with AHSA1/START domain